MRHIGAIAGREFKSFFVSPVAYVVLALWALLAATFFLASIISFNDAIVSAQQVGALDDLDMLNLNDHVIVPFLYSMWFVVVFALPAVTMGLFASEKANGTEELLLTSPLTIWEIVLGKFFAATAFVFVLTLVAAFFPGLLFIYGDPEVGKTWIGLGALFLVSVAYVAVGAFASSLTRNQLVAFLLTLALLLIFGLMLPPLASFAMASDAGGSESGLGAVLRYMGTMEHFDRLLTGLVETRDLTYFAVVVGTFLVLTKTSVESVRWR